jgi:hypothetical protein
MQAGQIGQAMGIGLAKQQGLAQAEREAMEAGGDPVKLAFSLARASMAAPGLDRSLGNIYQQLLDRTQSGQLGTGLGQNVTTTQLQNNDNNPGMEGEIDPKGTTPPSMDVPLDGNQTTKNEPMGQNTPIVLPPNKNYNPDQVQGVAHQYLAEMRPDLVEGTSAYGRVPTFNYQSKSTLRPEEEGQIRQKLQSQNVTPKVQDRIVETLRNDIQTRYAENLKNFGLDTARQQQINEKWNTFRTNSNGYLQPLLGKYSPTLGFGGKPRTANDLTNKYFQYAGELPIDLTPEQMHAQAGAMLQNDINRVDALSAIPGMPFIRDPSQVVENVKDHKEAYKDLYREGFYETLKEDAVNKNMGLEELHWTLFGDQTDKNSLRSISEIQAPKLYLNQKEEEFFKGTSQPINNPNYPKEKQIYVDKIAKKLQKIGKDDDLVLLRSQVLNSGGKESDFNDALTKAQENGLVLSPFQKTQMQEVRIPRRRPMWEIFSPSAWKQWINYTAGKR